MSNKTQLQTNNSALDALITRVNAAKDTAASLPDAGGESGGNIETCTVNFINCSRFDCTMSYIENGEIYECILGRIDGSTYTALKTHILLHDYEDWSLTFDRFILSSGVDVFYDSKSQGSIIGFDLSRANDEVTIEFVG